MKKKVIILMVLLSIFGCKERQARMPISRSSGVFMKQSVERNKKLVKNEESRIDSVIKSNPNKKYIASAKGYWYSYVTQNELDNLLPKTEDVVKYKYEIKDLSNKVIYSEIENGLQTYTVDKQEIMMGLRDGIKLMRKNEKVEFLFPSHIAFGYHGDNKKIKTNEPIICTVTLLDIKKSVAKKVIKTTNTIEATPKVEGDENKIREDKKDPQNESTPE